VVDEPSGGALSSQGCLGAATGHAHIIRQVAQHDVAIV
jgi:hypothetical protein